MLKFKLSLDFSAVVGLVSTNHISSANWKTFNLSRTSNFRSKHWNMRWISYARIEQVIYSHINHRIGHVHKNISRWFWFAHIFPVLTRSNNKNMQIFGRKRKNADIEWRRYTLNYFQQTKMTRENKHIEWKSSESDRYTKYKCWEHDICHASIEFSKW